MKEVKERILEGVEMLQSGEYWSLSILMYADDAVLLVSRGRDRERFVASWARLCERPCLKARRKRSQCVMCKWMVKILK